MPYKDREKQLEYFRKRNKREDVKASKRAWVEPPESRKKRLEKSKRYNSLESTKAQQRSYRKKALEIRMGQLNQFPCIACGEADPTVIDWHHVVPEDKLFELTGGIQRNHETWWNEVLKCVPLCCNCHRKVHSNKLCLIPPKLR